VSYLDFTFLAASAMLGISIGFNSLSTHGACTAIFVVVAAIIGLLFGSIQTLGKVSWIAWVGVAGILSAGESQWQIPPSLHQNPH
jgi:hypothetical protein